MTDSYLLHNGTRVFTDSSERPSMASFMLAYFSAFGYDDLHCAEFYASGGRGVDPVSALFSGKIRVDGDALMRYKDQNVDIEDDLTRELVDALVALPAASAALCAAL